MIHRSRRQLLKLDRLRPALPHLLFWVVVLGALLIIEAFVRSRVLSPAAFASPSETVGAIVRLVSNEGFIQDIWATLRRTLFGYFLGFLGGLAIACLIFALGPARSSGELLLDFFRSIPVTALVPIFLVVFGIGELNKIGIGAAAALFTSAITIWVGLRRAEARRARLMYLYRPGRWKALLFVILPEGGPAVVTASRLALSTALVLVVVAEMFIGTHVGIGHVINDKGYGDDRPGQYGAVLVAGLLGYTLNLCLAWIEQLVDRRNSA